MEDTIGYEALFSPRGVGLTQRLGSLEDCEPAPHQSHKVTVWYPPDQVQSNNDDYEVRCNLCGHISVADSLFEAKNLATLHEILRARPVKTRSVEL